MENDGAPDLWELPVPKQAIATHFHGDRTGGSAAMREANIPVFAHPFSVGLAQAYGQPVPQPVKGLEKAAVALDPVELYYPGAGHTRDNITVCDMTAYPGTVERLIEKYPNRQFTVPGHGSIAGDALTWTRERLAAAYNQQTR